MIFPILYFGNPLLRKVGADILFDHPDLNVLILNMWDTMYNFHGVGLAAPQIGKSLNLFIIDIGVLKTETNSLKQVFINSKIIEKFGDEYELEEGCLSIPHIREFIKRKPEIYIKYQDENFICHEEKFDGIAARVIQHEYDHCKGILFVDYLSEFKKRLLKNKLLNIAKGRI